MKVTVVPAQITSVEDKIAGNLTFNQVLLIILPIFVSTGLFVFLPPLTEFKVYKLIIASVITFASLSLAIRIKEKILLDWLAVRARYNLRPKYFVFDNNYATRRKRISADHLEDKLTEGISDAKPKQTAKLSFGDLLALEKLLGAQRSSLVLVRSKKGGLNVSVKQVR